MKKTFLPLLLVAFLLLTALPLQVVATEEVAISPDAISLSFTTSQDAVNLGETLNYNVSITYSGEPVLCGAAWLFNDKPVFGQVDENFWLANDSSSTLNWEINDEWYGWGDMEVGFMLYTKDGELASIRKSFRIIDDTNNKPVEPAKPVDIMEIVKPVCVEATVKYTTNFYSDVSLSRKIGTVAGGTNCQVLSSKTDYSNKIYTSDGRTGWVSVSALSVSDKNYTRATDITNQEKDLFVNTMGYKSNTPYLVWVHLEAQRVNVFLKKNGRWCIEQVFPCASGKNITPTITGEFTYSAYQNRWTYENYYVGPIMVFSGNYALHSVLMRYDGTIYNGTVGKPASNGCVRLLPNDIRWLVDYVPMGTKVVVY